MNRMVVLDAPLSDGFQRMMESFYRRASVRLDACSVRLLTEIDWSVEQPERIDIFGEAALCALAGLPRKTNAPLGNTFTYRGTVVPIKKLGGALIGMPTLPLEYVIKDQIYSKVVVADLSKSLTLTPENYNLNPTLDAVERFDAHTFAFDIENNRYTLEISVIGLCDAVGTAIVVPFRGAFISELRRIFERAECVIGQNSLQHDEPIMRLANVRINPAARHYDIMLMQHLLMPDLPHDLEFIASLLAHKRVWKHEAKLDPALYNARDVDATFQCWQQLLPMLRQEIA